MKTERTKKRTIPIDADNLKAIAEFKKIRRWKIEEIYNAAIRAGLEVLKNK